jgi:hypothetical protein
MNQHLVSAPPMVRKNAWAQPNRSEIREGRVRVCAARPAQIAPSTERFGI